MNRRSDPGSTGPRDARRGRRRRRPSAWLLASALTMLALGPVGSAAASVDGLIVRFRTAPSAPAESGNGVAVTGSAVAGGAVGASKHEPVLKTVPVDPATGWIADPAAATEAAADRAGVPLEFARLGADGSVVVRLPGPVPADEARDLARRLRADPTVVAAMPDLILRPAVATDPMFGAQWALPAADPVQARVGAMNATALWSRTRGRTRLGEAVVVAVLDSGRTAHPDLDSAWVGGYDFVSAAPDGSLAMAADGDGRDSDPADPGNACPTAAGGAQPSNWHGTTVAGLIAATADNGIGIAGAAPEARVLPVRVLGRCGGRLSDTLDAMQWAAGLPVPGIPANPNPARVINLSLASDEAEGCGSDSAALVQGVIDRIVARNVLIVAAAGNEGEAPNYPKATGSVGLPADCRGVLGVAAHTRSGDLAAYSSYGARVVLTAPGGAGGSGNGCKRQSLPECRGDALTTTTNSGTDAPVAPHYTSRFVGTSAAAPHVAAAAAMLFALKPEASPQDVISALASTARLWPASSFCLSTAGQGLCGSGMLDADAAATHLLTAPRVTVEPVGGPFAGASVVDLVARGSSNRYDAGALTWQWRQLSGPAATVTPGQGPRATVTLPATRSEVVVEARAVDPDGLATVVNIVLDVNNPPVPPVIDSRRVPLGALVSLSLAGTDPDGDSIRYTLIRGPAGLAVDPRTGLLTWVAAEAGEHVVVVALTDSFGARAPDLAIGIGVDARAVAPADSSAGASPAGGGGGAAGLAEAALWSLLLLASRVTRRRG